MNYKFIETAYTAQCFLHQSWYIRIENTVQMIDTDYWIKFEMNML